MIFSLILSCVELIINNAEHVYIYIYIQYISLYILSSCNRDANCLQDLLLSTVYFYVT